MKNSPKKTGRAPLSMETINTNVIEAEYAVRGEIVQVSGWRQSNIQWLRINKFFRMQLAQKYAKELEKGSGQLPFSKIVWCNIGNPQILGQKPITYFRQILAICEYPQVSWCVC